MKIFGLHIFTNKQLSRFIEVINMINEIKLDNKQ